MQFQMHIIIFITEKSSIISNRNSEARNCICTTWSR